MDNIIRLLYTRLVNLCQIAVNKCIIVKYSYDTGLDYSLKPTTM